MLDLCLFGPKVVVWLRNIRSLELSMNRIQTLVEI
jgi:hypothetical protein